MKKTLLIAAAALAAGVITSQAQVYSQNIVGYVNSVSVANQYNLIANPLTTGDDVLTNIFQGVPGGSTLQVWNGSGYTAYTYSALAKHWKNGTTIADNVKLPPGVGFFMKTPSNYTNTFVGTIVASSGADVTNSLPAGVYVPVSSLIPYAGAVTNSSFNLNVAGGSTLQQWDPSAQTFTAYTYSGLAKTWKVGTVSTNPVIRVGEGFFIKASSATNWVQSAP